MAKHKLTAEGFRVLPAWLVVTGYAGAVLLIVGLLLHAPRLKVAPIVFTLGGVLFAVVQIVSGYEGGNADVRRLRGQQILGSLLMAAAGGLMIAGTCGVSWARHNIWILCLTVGAVFWVYSTLRIPYALRK